MTRRWLRLCGATVLGLPLLAALPVHAQTYSWMDEHGTRVFSDQPPPPGTPANRILKAPRGLAPREQEAPAPADAVPEKADGAKADGAKSAAKKGPPTLAEREADYAKRAKERQESETKAATQAAARAKECAALRQTEADLVGTPRITRMNAAGEREFVGDDERERMIAQARRAAAGCR